MSFRVIADYDRCIGHGHCQTQVPEVFEVRADGYMYILRDVVDDALRPQPYLGYTLAEACEAAVDTCPEMALRIEQLPTR